MTHQRVLEIYRELENLSVPLHQSPEMGLAFLRDKMVDCRVAQDRVNNLVVEVNQAQSAVRQAVRNQKALVAISSGTSGQAENHRRLQELENQEDDVRYLLEAVKAKSSNLRMTSSDIRLLYGIMEQQIRLGEVYPNRRPHEHTHSTKPQQENSEMAAEVTAALHPIEQPEAQPAQKSIEETKLEPVPIVVVELDQELEEIDKFLGESEGES